jgi:hypothetical protein
VIGKFNVELVDVVDVKFEFVFVTPEEVFLQFGHERILLVTVEDRDPVEGLAEKNKDTLRIRAKTATVARDTRRCLRNK